MSSYCNALSLTWDYWNVICQCPNAKWKNEIMKGKWKLKEMLKSEIWKERKYEWYMLRKVIRKGMKVKWKNKEKIII